MPPSIAIKRYLHLLEQISVDDSFVFAFMGNAFVGDLAKVDSVAKQVEQRNQDIAFATAHAALNVGTV